MITVEGRVTVSELKMRIRFGEAEFHSFFVLEEREFFQCFFEVLNFTENLSEILIVVQIKFGVKSMLCLEGLKLQYRGLTDLISLSLSLFWNLNF